jgi:hypothetical protein|tara:strand:+ start:230 stop:514 length:285 start_codon:yes stop_codon:yes gene_type:complete
MKGDTPIHRKHAGEMSDEEHEAFIDGIRERRLAPIKAYEEAVLLRAEARKQHLEGQLDKQLEMFEKEMVRAEKVMDALEKRSIKLRAIKLELEL